MRDLSPETPGALVFRRPQTPPEGPARLALLQVEKRKRGESLRRSRKKLDLPPQTRLLALPRWIQPSYDALAECWEHGLDIAFLRGAGLIGLGLTLQAPPDASAHRLRRKQYQRALDDNWSSTFVRCLIDAKIANQREVLRGVWKSHLHINVQPAMHALGVLRRKLAHTNGLEKMRGIEGAAAHTYFEALGKLLLGSDFRRVPRIGHCPRNILFDWSYAHLARLFTLALHARYADLGLGWLHVPDNRRPSLALDLMEPLRPMLADRFVLRLLSGKWQRFFDHPQDNEVLDDSTAATPPPGHGGTDGGCSITQVKHSKFSQSNRLNSLGTSTLRERWLRWIYKTPGGQWRHVEATVQTWAASLENIQKLRFPSLE